MSDSVIAADGVSKWFRGPGGNRIMALNDVNLDVSRGELAIMMGPSGAGKSTLLQILAGLDRPDAGSVLIAGEDITRWSDVKLARLRRRQIGFVFQSFNLIDSLTVAENIALPIEIDGRPVDVERLLTLAESLGIADRLDHLPSQISGGQQQRVAVARALLAEPDVIFADEPTGALDEETAAGIISTLRSVAHDFGHAVIVVTHDPNLAAHGDRVFRFVEGALEHDTLYAAV